jgi:hypothetical protein
MSPQIKTRAVALAAALGALAVLPGASSAPGPARPATGPPRADLVTGGVRSYHRAWHSACDAPPLSPDAYNYPIRPFDRQHPIRSNFGDPRTDPLSAYEAYAPGALGSFNFHNGVDIEAATGTPVYPVVSGVAKIGYADEVIVRTADHRTFQYFHIRPVVHDGQRVLAYRTLLGRVEPGYLHVHLTEIDGTVVHNPLDPGHLEPYRDHTLPVVEGIRYTGLLGPPLDSQHLVGLVEIAAEAHDMPALPISSRLPGFGVTPALVAWRLAREHGRVVIPERIVADFRKTEPPNRDFWSVYAPGTHQNDYLAERHHFIGSPGAYLFRLTRAPLDTRRLPDGRYVVTVSAADTCGNRSSLSQTITIANHPGL